MRMIPRHQMIYPQLVFWNSLHSRLAARFPSGNLLHVTPQCFPVDSRVLKLVKLLFPFLFHLTQFCFVKSFVQFFLNKCKLYSINNIKQHWFWSSNQTSLSLAASGRLWIIFFSIVRSLMLCGVLSLVILGYA
jgi:hypothetical protein